MADYHNTSSLSQPQPKQPEPVHKVVKGSASIAKKSFFKQMAEDLFATDGRTVAESIKENVIIPSLKRFLMDIIHDGATTALYGRRSGGAPISTYSNPSYAANYGTSNGWWASQRQAAQTVPSITNIQSLYENIFFFYKDDPDPRQEAARLSAQKVLNEMIDRVRNYGWVSVSQMCTLSGTKVPNTYYLLDNWKWTDLDETNSFIVPHPSGGYSFDLPKPKYYPQ